jgi:hypothetical protein
MVGGALARASAFRVGLGVGGVVIAPGLRSSPSRSCDGWVCGLGGMSFAQHNRGFGHFFSAASSSRREAMVGVALARALSVWVSVGLPSCLDRVLAHLTCGFLTC